MSDCIFNCEGSRGTAMGQHSADCPSSQPAPAQPSAGPFYFTDAERKVVTAILGHPALTEQQSAIFWGNMERKVAAAVEAERRRHYSIGVDEAAAGHDRTVVHDGAGNPIELPPADSVSEAVPSHEGKPKYVRELYAAAAVTQQATKREAVSEAGLRHSVIKAITNYCSHEGEPIEGPEHCPDCKKIIDDVMDAVRPALSAAEADACDVCHYSAWVPTSEGRRCDWCWMAKRIASLDRQLAAVRELVMHCWIHQGYSDCGYLEMTIDQKVLYNEIIERSDEDATAAYGFSAKEYQAERKAAIAPPPSGEPRPRIVCLCGSTRFTVEMAAKSWELAKQGVIALGWNILLGDPEQESHGAEAEGVKEQIDELHKRKIDLADEVLVLNVGGYIGESTRSEIQYAEARGKSVRYLEPRSSADRSGT